MGVPPFLLWGLVLATAPSDGHGTMNRVTLDGGPYCQLSPGIAALVVDERRFARAARWSWPWSLGAGAMLTRGSSFKATLGATLEHHVFFIPDVSVHGVHLLFESRIGAGNRRVWGYGLIGVGAASTILDFGWNSRRLRHGVDAFGGFAIQYGGGAQFLVRRHFFIGGEIDLDVGYFFPAYRVNLDPFYYHTVTLEATLGWYF